MRRILVAALPPLAVLVAFFLPLAGLGALGRSALILAAFVAAGAIGGGGPRAGLLVAFPGVLLGLALTLIGAMEPIHLLYGVAMGAAALAASAGAAWSIAGRRREVA